MKWLGLAMVLTGVGAFAVFTKLWLKRRRRSDYDYIARNIAIANVGWTAALIAIGARLLVG